MRHVVLAACFIVGPFLALPAFAHEPRPPVHHAQAGHDPAECFCRAQGRVFAQGESICLKTEDGGRMAECTMATNVMSWGITDRRCPDT
jgi:hypothetical protein